MTAQCHPFDTLAEEFVRRRRQGERPTIAEYVTAHPQHADEIRELFPTLLAIEKLKESPIRSPRLLKPTWDNPPKRVGDCRLIREIGRGGMGVVYEAEQETLGRRVAVKLLPEELVSSDKHLQRFLRESRNTAKMHHSNIVSVFGVGYEPGFHYFVMQYIRGVGLDKVLLEIRQLVNSGAAPRDDTTADSTPSPTGGDSVESLEIAQGWLERSWSSKAAPEHRYWRSVANLGVKVAEALEYAHGRGIVHRDIKPGNLLIDRHGVVWVTDFGLAKTLSPSGSHPNRDIVGTMRYMAPEQFQGECDPRCDVYSLGLTLYELVTQQPAYIDSDVVKLVHSITHTNPQPPRALCPRIPVDLEAIILKAIARNPQRRYATAQALADDLRRYLEDKPIQARRMAIPGRLIKWTRRNPALAGLSALLIGTLLVGFGVISWQWRQAERERQRAELNLTYALDAMDETLSSFASTWMAHPDAPQSENRQEMIEFRIVASDNSALILQKALTFYNQFAAENAKNPRLQRDMAIGHHRIADIRQRLGQLQEAETAHRQALAGYEELRRRDPRDVELAHEMAAVWNDLGSVLLEMSRYQDAQVAYSAARDTLIPFVSNRLHSPACRYELARTYDQLGGILSRLGRRPAGRDYQQTASQLLDRLLHDDPNNPQYLLAQARCCVNLYRSFPFDDPQRTKLPWQATAIKNLETLVDTYPDVPDYKCELAETLTSTRTFDPSQQEASLRRAIEIARKLHAAYPTIPRYRACLARSLHWLGISLFNLKRTDESVSVQSEAADLYRALAEQFPGVTAYQSYAAWACFQYGEILRARDELAESRVALEEAISRQKAYLKLRPDDRFGERTLARHYQSLSETLKRMGENALAQDVKELARKLSSPRKPFTRPFEPAASSQTQSPP